MNKLQKQTAVVILAAGKGTRMNDLSKPKVMFTVAGKPMINYVIYQALNLMVDKILLVVGYQKEQVLEFVQEQFDGIDFVIQKEQLGTGHAVAQTQESLLNFKGNVLILSGDVPLLTEETLLNFLQTHLNSGAVASVLTVEPPVPNGYGRIVRDKKGKFLRIVEQKDASPEELEIGEINSGIYVVDVAVLFPALTSISNTNAQGEYYLTDIIGVLTDGNLPVNAWKSPNHAEVQGVNTAQQLLDAENLLKSMK